jgi:hypothetical protein
MLLPKRWTLTAAFAGLCVLLLTAVAFRWLCGSVASSALTPPTRISSICPGAHLGNAQIAPLGSCPWGQISRHATARSACHKHRRSSCFSRGMASACRHGRTSRNRTDQLRALRTTGTGLWVPSAAGEAPQRRPHQSRCGFLFSFWMPPHFRITYSPAAVASSFPRSSSKLFIY